MASNCPECGSGCLYKDGLRYTNEGQIQRFLCRVCGHRFSQPNNQIDITSQFRGLKPSSQLTKTSISNRDFSVKKSLNNPSFTFSKDVHSHNVTVTGKGLNVFCSNSSKRQVCAQKDAKNLDTALETKTIAGEKESQQVKGLLIQFAFHLKKEGISENTITTYIRFLQKLNKHANLEDPESVKTALATMNICENTKVVHCYAYDTFLKFLGKTWKKPKYQHRQKLPEFIPTTEEIEQLIAGLSKKMGTLITLIKETGMRISECLSIEWTALDFQNNVITLVNAKKNSLPRVFKVSNTCMNKLGNLPRKHSKVFGTMSRKNATWNLITARKRIAARTANPRIAKIHFHLIRHYFGTLLYHKTKDMDYVRRQMGHKSILNTQMYVNMEQALFTASSNEYYVKVASTVEEALKLVEVGFEYVTDMNEKKIFRKRK